MDNFFIWSMEKSIKIYLKKKPLKDNNFKVNCVNNLWVIDNHLKLKSVEAAKKNRYGNSTSSLL